MKPKNLILLALLFTGMTLTAQKSNFYIDIKVFLEGPFNNAQMDTWLNSGGYLPLIQPYSGDPWEYTGTEQVATIPNTDVVDWVLVELRETASTKSDTLIIARRAGFLLKDGTVASINGTSLMQFGNDITGDLLVVVYHRNHLAVMSSGPLQLTGGTYAWDFSDGAAKAFGGVLAHKEVAPGTWAMASGDGNGEGYVNNADKVDVWRPQAGQSGYYGGDFTLNGQVENNDKIECWAVNTGTSSQVPPATNGWTCGYLLKDERDGRLYKTVAINDQCWMAENLNFGTMIPGNTNQSDNGISEKYCYHDSVAYCDVYGGLYQWDEMMQYSTIPGVQGLCPPNGGWHLPSDAEWCAMEQFVDPNINCSATGWSGVDGGGKLKEAGTVHWKEPNTGGTNSSGFTALPGGRWGPSGSSQVKVYGEWWTSSIRTGNDRWKRALYYNYSTVNRYYRTKSNGLSVRCLLDSSVSPPDPPGIPNNPQPGDYSAFFATDTTLSWSCSSPVGVPLTFDIYFGSSSPPPLLASGMPDTTFPTGTLETATVYYWKIVARDNLNNLATEGPVWSFTVLKEYGWQCGQDITHPYDGQTYSTVLMGDQCWFAENLNVGTMITASYNGQSDNGIYEKYCYANNPYYCQVYGGLYQYGETVDYNLANGARGLCPNGWHIPTNEEFKKLEGFADTQFPYPDPEWDLEGQYRGFDVALHLKSDALWDGNNTYGFGLLPGGYISIMEPGSFFGLGDLGKFWTSTLYPNEPEGYVRTLVSGNNKVYNDGGSLTWTGNAYSARCIKDLPFNEPPEAPHDPQPPDGATDIPVNTPLQWSCSDPDGGNLSYNIYLGISTNPGLYAVNVQDTSFNAALDHETLYHWRVVACDNQGDSTSGPVWSFHTEALVCPAHFTDPRDGQVYTVTQVENRCWMAENLNYGSMIPGTQGSTDNGIPEKYCYGDDPANCDTYGALYQWDELMQYGLMGGIKGLCPPTGGWYIPTDEDWKMLEGAADSQYGYPDPVWDATGWRGTDAGTNLKASSGWNSGGNGTDILGFSVLPSGNRGTTGTYNGIGQFANFWTSDTVSVSKTLIHGFSYVNPAAFRGELSRQFGFGLRCIMGTPVNQPPVTPSSPQPPDGSTGNGIDTDLRWYCRDYDGDPLSYDVFFGETNPPVLLANGVTDTVFDPGALEYNKTYYWKIIAKDNQNNSSEGPVWSFSTAVSWQCGLNWVDSRDGQTYGTIQVGERCWMASNMNIGTMITGSVSMTNNGVLEKYCFGNNPANCDTYGGLYQWNEAMQYSSDTVAQGICPPDGGWYIPTDYEWKVLEGTADSQYPVGDPVWNAEGFRGFDAGGNLKEEGTTHWNSPNTGATNSSGFTVLPAGYLLSGAFWEMGIYGYFWTAVQKQAGLPWVRLLYNESQQVYRYGMANYHGFSVRCIKDLPNQPPAIPYDPEPADGAQGQPVNLILHWACSDPEGDPLTYDIYFGAVDPPVQVATGQADTLYSLNVLAYSTDYFWKIVAHDDQGNTTEGPVWTFKTIAQATFQCGDTLTDSRDGRKYATVQIGNQCWMAENLNYGTMIPPYTQSNNGIPEKACYSNNIFNCEVYGGLYQWQELMDYNLTAGSQGMCPSDGGGWHVATNGEWIVLIDYLGGASVAGGKLKEAGLAHWLPPNTGATNSSEFTALPGGLDGGYLGKYASFWTSTTDFNSGYQPYVKTLSYITTSVNSSPYYEGNLYSARCIRDYPNLPPNQPVCIQPPNGGWSGEYEAVLVWGCTDPENDPLLYDVYFAPIGSPLELVLEDYDPIIYIWPTMQVTPANTYHWKIVAKDDHNNETEGPVWTFTADSN